MGQNLKKMLIVLLAAVVAFGSLFAACNSPAAPVTEETDEPTAEPSPTPEPRDVSNDTPIAASMVYANEMANDVQGFYTSAKRSEYVLKNNTMQLTQELMADGAKGISEFAGANGQVYFTTPMQTYVKDTGGNEWTVANALGSGRINTTRLGYYYYESHMRDLGLGMGGEAAFDSVTEVKDLKTKWVAHDGTLEEGSGGSAVFTVGSIHDPYFVIRSFNVPAEKVNAVEVTLSIKGSSSSVEMFIDDGSDYNQAQSMKFTVIADNSPHTYLLDISAIQSGGALQGVRLDIGENIGDVITLSSLRIVKTRSETPALKVEQTYHVFPEKMHQEYRVVATDLVENVSEMGMVWKVDKSTVSALSIKDAGGTHSDTNIDPDTVEYVAFDFTDAGVCGIIIPNDADYAGRVTVTEENGMYVVRQQYTGKLSLKAKRDAKVANRLYNDSTHSFDGIDREAWLERNPLTADNFTVTETNSSTRFKYYDAVRGVYMFNLKGTSFSTAYIAKNRNKYFSADITVNNDASDRIIYFNFSADSECLECGALLDGNGVLVPIPLEVCKNFTYEKEEKIYDPTDVPYSNTFFPLKLKANESLSFTHMHLYQNWGQYPLKQISSIQFHVSYYHLSTGVTESNCIAPYYVYGRDGWTLPDFRGCSGIMWSSQPQFTAGGHNKFVSYTTSDGYVYRAEYTGSNILSYGPTYADLEYSYLADTGEYEYTLRHMEFPQTDENRTYYTLSLKFLQDKSFDNVAEEFSLHYFNSRDQKFDKMSYLSEDGSVKTLVTDFSKKNLSTVKLAKDSFWFAFYGSSNEDCMNEALVLKKYNIVLNGETWTGNFVLRSGYDGVLNNISDLSLDLGKYTFKKGDTIYMEFMLVPWGNTDHNTYSNIERIYEDSVLKPLTLTVKTGSLIEEPFLPHLLCDNNSAEFSITGGRNNNVVRIDGFTAFGKPVIEKLNASGEWEVYDASVEAFDGYGVHYIWDGTYGYSFVYTTDSPDDVHTFRITVK